MSVIKKYTIHLLLIFHIIGIALFIYLKAAPNISYLTILLSALLILVNEPKSNKSVLLFLTIFFFGYLIELIGIQTGWLFGNYYYQPAMGPMLMATPIIIGATWYAVVVGAANIARNIKASIIGRSLLAGLFAVFLDFFIEKVAIAYGFWNWESGVVPFYNYLCWFIFSALFAFIYLHFQKSTNKNSIYLFIIWLGFFALLTLFRA